MLGFFDLYSTLDRNTCIVAFKKKDRSTRVMLCTKSLPTISAFCKITQTEAMTCINRTKRLESSDTGYLSVFDLEKKDGRIINTSNLLFYLDLGNLVTEEQFSNALDKLSKCKEEYKDKSIL